MPAASEPPTPRELPGPGSSRLFQAPPLQSSFLRRVSGTSFHGATVRRTQSFGSGWRARQAIQARSWRPAVLIQQDGLLLVPGFTSLSCTGFLKYRCNLGLWLILFNFLLYCIIFSQAKPSTLLSPLQTWLAWHIHWVRQPNASPTAAPLWAPLPVHPTSNTQLPSAPPPTDTEPCCPLTCGPMYMLIPSTTIYCPLTLRQEVCTQFLVWKI